MNFDDDEEKERLGLAHGWFRITSPAPPVFLASLYPIKKVVSL